VSLDDTPELMTLAEVCRTFQVHPRTVTRWADDGKLLVTRTPGNHRRYFRLQVDAIIKGRSLTPAEIETLRDLAGQS